MPGRQNQLQLHAFQPGFLAGSAGLVAGKPKPICEPDVLHHGTLIPSANLVDIVLPTDVRSCQPLGD
jgi:hypothetical protein